LEREIIQTDLEKKNADLLNGYALDLKQVSTCHQNQYFHE
jgi:hypothetical protein